MNTEKIAISLYESRVPDFAEAELERLYGNIYSSLAQFRADGDLEGIDTYAVRRGERVTCLLLFRQQGSMVRVINEGMVLTEGDIRGFAQHIFTKFPKIKLISFHAIATSMRTLPFRFQHFNCLEDFVLSLPRTQEEYLASLGKSTRSYINRYLNKLKRELPALQFRIYTTGEVQDQQVRDIILLNRHRMRGREHAHPNEEVEIARIIHLARQRGLVGVMSIDGRVCAGVINFRAGENFFLETLAHDPAYNEFRLGTLCCYLTICECIARGAQEYHFLWGHYEYKNRLLGVRRDLDHITIYRSPMQMVWHADVALRNTIKSAIRRTKIWLHNAQRAEKPRLTSRVAIHVLNYARNARRYASGILTRSK